MTSPKGSPADIGARQMMRQMLQQWGIGGLYKDAESLLTQGFDPGTIILQLQNTDIYKKRFVANEARLKAGLVALSPAEYVALETQYKTVMRTFGLPPGFYDSEKDLAGFIGADVSPTELTERATVAQKIWLSTDKETQKIWTEWHGLSNGAAIAAILDPDIALPVIERMAVSAQIGGAAARNGMSVSQSRAELFADFGLDPSGAMEAYSEIGQRDATTDSIAKRFGTTFSQAEQEDERILGLASATRKLDSLKQGETNLFEARAGATQGALSRKGSGSY